MPEAKGTRAKIKIKETYSVELDYVDQVFEVVSSLLRQEKKTGVKARKSIVFGC